MEMIGRWADQFDTTLSLHLLPNNLRTVQMGWTTFQWLAGVENNVPGRRLVTDQCFTNVLYVENESACVEAERPAHTQTRTHLRTVDAQATTYAEGAVRYYQRSDHLLRSTS